jgi:FkbM family methyltransferase
VSWEPPSTLEERVKRTLIPARWELARIVRREWKKGEPELRLAPHLADPERLALDIGANRGIWTHILSRHARHVMAFEPNPKMFRILEAALPANAEASPVALSDRDGEAELEVPQLRGGWSNQHASLNPDRNQGREVRTVPVEMKRLDSLDLEPVGFIKIDVEGHEKAVIDGAKSLIERDHPRMIMELEERHTGIPIEDSIAQVEAMGYETFFLRQGTLRRIREFDPDREHRERVDQPGYVFNFVFIPR